MRDRARRMPLLTATALLVVTAFFLYQLARPEILTALRRDLPALVAGEWWRLLSPLLVQADGASQYLLNAIGLAGIGTAVERKIGPRWWILLLMAGGLAGEIAGYAWHPTGAGSSFAVCGLAGGLAAFAWRRRMFGDSLLHFTWYWITALTGLSLAGPAAAIALFLVLAGIEAACRFGKLPREVAISLLSGAMFLQALGLAALGDSHGPALLAGTALGLLIRPPERRRAASGLES